VALGRLTEAIAEQEMNAEGPIVTALGKLTEASLVQEAKAELPIVVALGMLTEARLVQRENAEVPIVVALGRLTEARAIQSRKAEPDIVLIFAPPLTFVTVDARNVCPNPVTGKASNISGIKTAFGPVYPVSVIFVPSLVHVQ
jgi:hypothetical protein